MNEETASPTEWQDAALAAALFAVDPAHLHGIWIRAKSGPVRDRWQELLRELFPPETPFGKLPLNATEESLFGGVDLTATLASARLVWRPGLLSRLDGGVLFIPLAERVPQSLAAQLGSVLDSGELVLEQNGLSKRSYVMLNAIALDESEPDDAPPPAVLRDRLALQFGLSQTGIRDTVSMPFGAEDIAAARTILPNVEIPDAVLAAICQASLELGIASMRAPLFAVAAAKANAALEGRMEVSADDAAAAARFVLAPRATMFPASEEPQNQPEQEDNESKGESEGDNRAAEMADMIIAAAQAALPPNLLARLPKTVQKGSAKSQGGRSGIERLGGERGRPHGVRRARGKRGEKISAVDTIRAAAPWQRLRRQHANHTTAKFHVRYDDLRVRRFKSFVQTTTIFAVDASGSSAIQRLSEAKGAVELLLADCYVRRDQVALIAFRGHEANILLPPTRSLVRAKRALNALAGGGGTPLAAGIRAACVLAAKTRHNGGFPIVVLLTDGRANIAANRDANRETAHADAMKIARFLRESDIPSLLVDTSPRPQAKAGQLAREMGALYLPLPYADARTISAAARSMSSS
jgi:magnesium chelatase subunit D